MNDDIKWLVKCLYHLAITMLLVGVATNKFQNSHPYQFGFFVVAAIVSYRNFKRSLKSA